MDTLSFSVLRVRGDLGKLLTFAKLYANLNLKRLEKVNDEIFTLTPEVAVEALHLALQPIAGMLAKIDDRTKILFNALKTITEVEISSETNQEKNVGFDKKGSEINKRVREKIAVKIGKAERTIRDFFAQLCASGYVSDDGRKPKTFTLLYDVDDIEKKTAGLLEKTKSADGLMEEMRKEAREWVKTALENFSVVDGQEKTSLLDKDKRNDEKLLPSTEEKISNTILGNSQTDLAKQGLDNWQNNKLPIKQGDNKRKTDFFYEKIKSSPKLRCDCGKNDSEYKITILNEALKGDVLFRCEDCFQHLKTEFPLAVWEKKGEVEQL